MNDCFSFGQTYINGKTSKMSCYGIVFQFVGHKNIIVYKKIRGQLFKKFVGHKNIKGQQFRKIV